MFQKMAAFNSDGTNEDEKLSSGNTDDSLVQRDKLKASSTEKGTRYKCKECGLKMMNKSNLNTHIRSIHERIKYPCDQCQHETTSKGHLAQHRRAVHEGIKYPCGDVSMKQHPKDILHNTEELSMKE